MVLHRPVECAPLLGHVNHATPRSQPAAAAMSALAIYHEARTRTHRWLLDDQAVCTACEMQTGNLRGMSLPKIYGRASTPFASPICRAVMIRERSSLLPLTYLFPARRETLYHR